MRLSTLLWPVLTLAFVSGCAAGFSYRYNADDSITLKGWSQGTEGIPCPTDLVIPSSIEGKPVTAIAEGAFQDEAGVTSITIPESVKVIGKEAFDGCDAIKTLTVSSSHLQAFDSLNLANVKDLYTRPPFYEQYPVNAQIHACLPEGTTSIEAGMFESCNWLTEFEIPEGVTEIGDSAFADCDYLTAITIPEGVTKIGDSAFQGAGLTSVTLPASLKTIGTSAFADCANLTSITIPEGVTEIADSAFQGTGLTAVTLPASVMTIGTGVFENCPNLSSIIIADGATEVWNGAFKGCTNLTSVTLPASVKTIGMGAFADCANLTSITIPEGVTEIGGFAFRGAGLTAVTLPASVKTIGEKAFAGCANLTSIAIPEGVTEIAGFAFQGSGLTAVTLPASVTTIGAGAFANCANLISITIPEGVTEIAASAFQGTRLTSVTLPASVKTIGEHAFEACAQLTSITIPTGVTQIADSTFKGCSGLTEIIVPNGVTSIGAGAFANCSGLTTITIPESVKTIDEGAFEGCPALATVHGNVNWQDFKGSQYYVDKNPFKKWKDPSTGLSWSYEILPDNTVKVTGGTVSNYRLEIPDKMDGYPVTVIGSKAFQIEIDKGFNRIDFVALPDSVRTIEPYAFANNYKENTFNAIKDEFWANCVTTLYLPANLETIGQSAFANWYDLDTVIFPDGLKSIGPDAFLNCKSLISVELPENVTSIEANAFNGCTSLASVIISYSTCAKGLDPKAFSRCDALELIAIKGGPSSLTLYEDQPGFKYPREWRSCSWWISAEFKSQWMMAQMRGAFKGIDISVAYADKWEGFLDQVRDIAERVAKSNRSSRAYEREEIIRRHNNRSSYY